MTTLAAALFPCAAARTAARSQGHRAADRSTIVSTTRRTVAFRLALAGAYASAAVFAFCVIASIAYHWHQAVTKPGIAVSVVALAACAVVLNLTAGDE